MFCAVIMIPAAFVQLYWQGRISAGYWIAVALIVVLVASLPTLFSTLIGCVISFLSSRLKHKALVANILYLGVFLAIFAGIFSLQMRLTNKLPTRAELSNFVVNWLYPFELIHRAILGDGWAFFIFLLGVLVPFLLIIYLFSAKYQKILAGLVPYAGKSDYQMKRIGISAPFNALFQKEWKRYFGCPVYVANTLLGPIFLLVGGRKKLMDFKGVTFDSDDRVWCQNCTAASHNLAGGFDCRFVRDNCISHEFIGCDTFVLFMFVI